jgi:hypothetical protein
LLQQSKKRHMYLIHHIPSTTSTVCALSIDANIGWHDLSILVESKKMILLYIFIDN